MGSGESSTRKVSFCVDAEGRVQVFSGVKLSEDVVQRMRVVANQDPEPSLPPRPRTPSPPPQTPTPRPRPQSPITSSAEDLKKRYEIQRSLIQEELSRLARLEREAARLEMSRALYRERLATRTLSDRADILDNFYKEQLAQLLKTNHTGQQFHQAADNAEAYIRARSTEAACSGLLAQILACYRGNSTQTLLCSDLIEQYLRCVNAANKNL